MEAGELSKGSCGDDFLVPQKNGSTTCLVGKYSAQTAEVIAALQTASSPKACAKLCDATDGCLAFEMSGASLEETKCEMWMSSPTLSQHSSSRPHWCYAKSNYEAGPGMVIEGYAELYDDGKSGACRYMEAGELSKGSCGDDFLVPQKNGSTTCLVGKYSAQTAEVIVALQTASSPQTCAELCDKTEGCGAFEMSGGTLEATKCEMWTSTPTFSQHSTSRPHWCYAKLNYEASPGMAVAGYSEMRDDEGQSGACRYMDAEELSKGSCGLDFIVPQKDGNTTCLVGKYDEQTAEVIDALQTAGNPKACGDLCDRTENCVAFEMSGGTLASTKCELWSATPTLNQFSSSRPHWCYVKSS